LFPYITQVSACKYIGKHLLAQWFFEESFRKPDKQRDGDLTSLQREAQQIFSDNAIPGIIFLYRIDPELFGKSLVIGRYEMIQHEVLAFASVAIFPTSLVNV
jgi:hypothetical protein